MAWQITKAWENLHKTYNCIMITNIVLPPLLQLIAANIY